MSCSASAGRSRVLGWKEVARIIQATAERALTARGTVVPTAGTCESFNPKRRNEPLDARIFHSLAEAIKPTMP